MPSLATRGSSLVSLLFALAFFWLCLAIGRRLLRWFGAASGMERLQKAVLAVALGAGTLQFVPFALGALGHMQPENLRIALGLVFLLFIPDQIALAHSLAAAWRERGGADRFSLAWAAALSPALLMATAVALAPTLDADGLSYHLTVPKRWMFTGRLDYLETLPYSNAPMGLEMLFALGMAFDGDVAAKCIHLALGAAATLGVFCFGRSLHSRMVGAVAATLFLVGPGGAATILGFAYVEGAAALAIVAGCIAWLTWYRARVAGDLHIAALLAGIAVAFKISSALFPVALLALTAIVLWPGLRGGAAALLPWLGRLTGFGLLVVLPCVPWFTRAFLLTGNPLFPLLANKIPSRDLTPDLATKVDQYNRYMTWGNSLGREWTMEQRAWVLIGVGVVWACLGALVFSRMRLRMTRPAVVVITLTGLAQLAAAGIYLRYWLPLSAALFVPMVAVLGALLARRQVRLAWLALTLIASSLAARRIYYEGGAHPAQWARASLGLTDRREFLRDRIPLYPLYELANRTLPADAGVVLSSYCGSFYIDRRTYCAEMVQTSLRFSSWDEFIADLQTLHITHVIAPSDLATGGPTPPLGGSSVSSVTRADQYTVMRKLLTQHARGLGTASDQGLYEIDPSAFAAH